MSPSLTSVRSVPGAATGRSPASSLLAGTRQSIHEAVLDEGPPRDEAVAPGDLLALVDLASGVRDRHLVDPDAAAQDLRRDLGLELEARRPQGDAVEHRTVEELVTRLHVGERRVVEHVGD